MGVHDVVDITVGASAQNLAVHGDHVFVAVESGTQVAVIDTTTNVVSGHLDVGDGPWWLAAVETTTPTGDTVPKLYVLQGSDMSMTVIGLDPLGVPTAHFSLASFGGLQIVASQLADTRRGGVYLLDQNNARLLVIDGQTNEVTEEITLGHYGFRMVVSADGSRVYVSHLLDKLISVIDVTVTPPAITEVPVAQWPLDVFLSPRGERLYVAHWISQVAGLFRVIDLTTMLAGSVNTGLQPMTIAGNDDRAYVSCIAGKCIQVLDTTTVPPRVVETIPIDGSPGYMVMSEDGKTLYANDFNGDAVHAVAVATS